MLGELKILLFLKNTLRKMLTGTVFLQEAHSSLKGETRWNDEFKRQMFFSHGTTSPCGVALGYFATKSFKVEDMKSDKSDRFLLDAKIDYQNFVLLNIYNANVEK